MTAAPDRLDADGESDSSRLRAVFAVGLVGVVALAGVGALPVAGVAHAADGASVSDAPDAGSTDASYGTNHTGDDWPDNCTAATHAVGPGTYNGTLTPGDADALRLDVSTGTELVANVTLRTLSGINVTTPERAGPAFLYTTRTGERVNLLADVTYDGTSDALRIGRNATVQLYAMGSNEGPRCLLVRPLGDDESGTWTIAFSKS